ncbi:hypothetical protein [Weizmannia acidilactici]|nr:hypothetical protein [Weizmannia acidilactici]
MNEGTVIGLDKVDPDRYTITVPDEDGIFKMTIPEKIWNRKPALFERKINAYTEKVLSPGDAVPTDWLKQTDDLEVHGLDFEK